MAFIVITDKNLKPENIKKGVKILKTVGILDVSINNQDKTVDSSTSSQDITADNGYTGLGTVTVTPYSLESQSHSLKLYSAGQYSYTPSQGYDGISQIDLDISLVGQVKYVDASTNDITVEASSPCAMLSEVRINAVTSSIDSNITPENIKAGVTILGVQGTYQGE